MITEDYCSFEVAQLLKEKGFKEYTNMVYKNELVKAYKEGKTGTQTWVKNFYRQKESDSLFTLCPTHQMAMKWLREEKNLFIDISFINHHTKDEILNTVWCFAVFYLTNPDAPYYKDIEYSTYEQAVETALKYSLENLI